MAIKTETIQIARIPKVDIKRRKLKRALEHVFDILRDPRKHDALARAEARNYLMDLFGKTPPDSRRGRHIGGATIGLSAKGVSCAVSAEVFRTIVSELAGSHLIQAVKALRVATNLGLKESKDIVENDLTIQREVRRFKKP